MRTASGHRFGVASMRVPPTTIRTVPEPEEPITKETLTAKISSGMNADSEHNIRRYRNTHQPSDDEDEDERESSPESASEVPCGNFDDGMQDATSMPQCARPLDEKDGRPSEMLRTPSSQLDFDKPFACQAKKYDLHRIPAEIRMNIYELVLVSDKPIRATQHPRDAIPPLLHTCRQVRLEALPVFYGRNTFLHVISDANTAHICHWLTSIGASCCRFITSLTICCEGIVRSFDYTDDDYYGVSQGWMAMVKTLHRNQVRREAICTFSDSYDRDEFEEVEQANFYTGEFHRKVMAGYLERAGYRIEPFAGSMALYEPRAPDRYCTAPESDLIEVDARRKRDMDCSVRRFKAQQAARRLQAYLAGGGTQHITDFDHVSKTPTYRFYRAADASEEPELSHGYQDFISSLAGRKAWASDATSSERIPASFTRQAADSSSSMAGFEASRSPSGSSMSGVKRKRDADDEELCGGSSGTKGAQDVKRLKFSTGSKDNGNGVQDSVGATKSRRMVFLRAGRSRVSILKVKSSGRIRRQP